MKETRCPNSGALLFTPEASELETIALKEDNKQLKERLDRMEILLQSLIKDSNV